MFLAVYKGVGMECRHPGNDAWYDVNFVCDGETLAMNCVYFSDVYMETFQADKFKTTEAVGGIWYFSRVVCNIYKMITARLFKVRQLVCFRE
jgi:hypothetical protein